MNLSQLEVLVAIVDSGSLTEAAEVVGLTQSAVSYSLSKLEAELGVTLLERGRQGVTVTRIGAEIVQHARVILTQVEVIRQKTARERGLAVGKIRFGCVPTVPGRLLTGVIRDFQHQFPDIEIVLFEGNPQELVEWLSIGVIDVATVISPHDYPASIHFVHNEIKLITSVDHPLAAVAQVDLMQLADESLVGPKREYVTLSRLAGLNTLPRLRYEVSTQNTIFAMVRENMGVSLMPEMLVDPSTEGVAMLSFAPPLFLDVFLAAPTPSPAVEAFMSAAHNWSREHGFLIENT